MIKTELLTDNPNNSQNAVEFEDFLPRYEKIEFAHGENELIFPITLVNNKQPNVEGKTAEGNKIDEDDVEDEENEGVCDVTFKVRLEKPEP